MKNNKFATYYRLDWTDPQGNQGCSNLFYGCTEVDETYMKTLVKHLNCEFPGWKHSYKVICLPEQAK